jgi:hypothetical protein
MIFEQYILFKAEVGVNSMFIVMSYYVLRVRVKVDNLFMSNQVARTWIETKTL